MNYILVIFLLLSTTGLMGLALMYQPDEENSIVKRLEQRSTGEQPQKNVNT
ncbi:MAG: hypothetical protein ACFFC7_27530 [Candidatus Hermodarchaeota archaeon]